MLLLLPPWLPYCYLGSRVWTWSQEKSGLRWNDLVEKFHKKVWDCLCLSFQSYFCFIFSHKNQRKGEVRSFAMPGKLLHIMFGDFSRAQSIPPVPTAASGLATFFSISKLYVSSRLSPSIDIQTQFFAPEPAIAHCSIMQGSILWKSVHHCLLAQRILKQSNKCVWPFIIHILLGVTTSEEGLCLLAFYTGSGNPLKIYFSVRGGNLPFWTH